MSKRKNVSELETPFSQFRKTGGLGTLGKTLGEGSSGKKTPKRAQEDSEGGGGTAGKAVHSAGFIGAGSVVLR